MTATLSVVRCRAEGYSSRYGIGLTIAENEWNPIHQTAGLLRMHKTDENVVGASGLCECDLTRSYHCFPSPLTSMSAVARSSRQADRVVLRLSQTRLTTRVIRHSTLRFDRLRVSLVRSSTLHRPQNSAGNSRQLRFLRCRWHQLAVFKKRFLPLES